MQTQGTQAAQPRSSLTKCSVQTERLTDVRLCVAQPVVRNCESNQCRKRNRKNYCQQCIVFYLFDLYLLLFSTEQLFVLKGAINTKIWLLMCDYAHIVNVSVSSFTTHTHTRARTHTDTHEQTHKVSKARWRSKEKINRKQKGSRGKTEGEGKSQRSEKEKKPECEFRGKNPPETYKQVKSGAASLASQHRGWWHTELPGWFLQLSSKLVQRLADWYTDWLTGGSDLVYPVFVQQKHFCCSACRTKSSSPRRHTKNHLKQH